MFGLQAKALVGAAGLLAIVAVGWYIDRLQSDLDQTSADLERSQAALEQSEENREFEQAQQSAVSVIDTIRTEALNDAKAEIDDLRGRLAAGAVELRIDATCPDSPVPEAAGDTGVDSRTGARLTDAAERHYTTFRDRISRATEQLGACQDILQEVKKRPTE